MLCSSRLTSSLIPICSVRSSATLFPINPRAAICRQTSLYPKSKTTTSGAARNCSLAAATASRRVDLRNARRKRRFALRARRNELHFEKMMVHEASEKIARIPSTVQVTGPEVCTSSQKLTSKKSWLKFTVCTQFHCKRKRLSNRREKKCFINLGYNLNVIAELAVENYAVIERLRVRFHRGLNLLTGETGSGKSIVVDALGRLFGGRASADMV